MPTFWDSDSFNLTEVARSSSRGALLAEGRVWDVVVHPGPGCSLAGGCAGSARPCCLPSRPRTHTAARPARTSHCRPPRPLVTLPPAPPSRHTADRPVLSSHCRPPRPLVTLPARHTAARPARSSHPRPPRPLVTPPSAPPARHSSHCPLVTLPPAPPARHTAARPARSSHCPPVTLPFCMWPQSC